MPGLAVSLGLFSALTLALVNVTIKGSGDILVSRAVHSMTSALILLPVAFLLPLPDAQTWGALAVAVPIHFLYQVALIRALQKGDLSLVFPVMRGSAPLLTAVAAYLLLGETLTPLAVIGLAIATLAVCIFAISPNPTTLQKHPDRSALFWAAMTAIGVALYNVADARGVRLAPHASTYIVWLFLLDWIGVGLMAAIARRGQWVATVKSQWRYGAIAGTLSICSYGSALYAFTLMETAKVSALRETAIVFAALFGWLLLKERLGGRRILAALGLTAGLLIMQLAG